MSIYFSYKANKEGLSSLSFEIFGIEVNTPKEFFELFNKNIQKTFLSIKVNQLSAKIIFITNLCEKLLDQQTNIYKLLSFLKRLSTEININQKENHLLLSSLYFSLKNIDQRGYCLNYIFENYDISDYFNLFESYIQSDETKIKSSFILSVFKKLLLENKESIFSSLSILTKKDKLKKYLQPIPNSETIISYFEFISLDANSNINSIKSSLEKERETYKEELFILDLFINNKITELLTYKSNKIHNSSLKTLQSSLLSELLEKDPGKCSVDIIKLYEMTKLNFDENEDLFIELFDKIQLIYKIDYKSRRIMYSYKQIDKSKVSLMKERIIKLQRKLKFNIIS